MKAIFTPSQQRAHDLCIQQAEGISALSLMERAAFRLYKTMLPEIQRIQPKHIAVLVGPGNNGGDGLALARYLSAHSMVQVLRLKSAQYSPENLEQAQALIPLSHRIYLTEFQPDRPAEFQSFLTTDLWIDALFGNGLSRQLHVDFAPFFAWILSIGKPVWAIDSPSGLPSRPEEFGLENPVLPAQKTYCIDRPTFSMLFPESAPFLGQWQVVPLSHFESKDPDAKLGCWVESADVQRRLPKRRIQAHKGNQGWLALIGGGEGGEGALCLSSGAALNMGAGKILALGQSSARAPLLSRHPEVQFQDMAVLGMVLPEKISALAMGPGAGKAEAFINWLKFALEFPSIPRVFDADALNAMAENRLVQPFQGQVVLTPHPGEFDRLFGTSERSEQRWQKALEAAQKWNCHIVLKNHITWVFTPEGQAFALNFGTPALAKGGSGDSLTGMLGALLARGLQTTNACLLAVALHGRAARLMEMQRGTDSVNPSELPDYLGLAYRTFEQGERM
jgi:NAD(P)H-hydrate epimerase